MRKRMTSGWGKKQRERDRELLWLARLRSTVSATHVSTISHSSHLGSSLFTGLLVSDRSLPSRAGGWSPPGRWSPGTRGARSASVLQDAARLGCSGGPLEVCRDYWRCSLRGSSVAALHCTLSGCWALTPLSAGRGSLGESWGSCIRLLTCEEECLGVFPDLGTWTERRSVGGRYRSQWLPHGVDRTLAGVWSWETRWMVEVDTGFPPSSRRSGFGPNWIRNRTNVAHVSAAGEFARVWEADLDPSRPLWPNHSALRRASLPASVAGLCRCAGIHSLRSRSCFVPTCTFPSRSSVDYWTKECCCVNGGGVFDPWSSTQPGLRALPRWRMQRLQRQPAGSK